METTMPHIPRSIVSADDDEEDIDEDIVHGSFKDESVQEKEISSRLRSKLPENTSAGGKGRCRKKGASNGPPAVQEPIEPVAVVAPAISSASTDRHRGKADKQEMKKKWMGLYTQATGLYNGTKSSYGGTSRPTYGALLQLLQDAYEALPMPSDMLLDEPVYKSLKEAMLELIEVSDLSLEW
jgi:hypothetical protein